MLLRILIHTARWFDKELDHIIMSVLFFFRRAKIFVTLQRLMYVYRMRFYVS